MRMEHQASKNGYITLEKEYPSKEQMYIVNT